MFCQHEKRKFESALPNRGKILPAFFLSLFRGKKKVEDPLTINNSFTHHQLQLLQCPLCLKAVFLVKGEGNKNMKFLTNVPFMLYQQYLLLITL